MCSAVLSVDMADESGKFVSDSTALGIESMKLHKQRLSKLGKSAHRGDYKLPEPDIITIVGGILISDSAQVRLVQTLSHQSQLERCCGEFAVACCLRDIDIPGA